MHVRFSLLSISLPSSAKLQREITEFEVLWRASALGDKFSFFSLKLSAAHNGFIPEGLPGTTLTYEKAWNSREVIAIARIYVLR